MSQEPDGNPNIRVEITDASEFHCFRLVLNPSSVPVNLGVSKEAEEPETYTPSIEIMLHARSLVDLIHKCSLALCDWQAQTTGYLIDRIGVKE
jgi:hypothetical protein